VFIFLEIFVAMLKNCIGLGLQGYLKQKYNYIKYDINFMYFYP